MFTEHLCLKNFPAVFEKLEFLTKGRKLLSPSYEEEVLLPRSTTKLSRPFERFSSPK